MRNPLKQNVGYFHNKHGNFDIIMEIGIPVNGASFKK